MKRRGAAVDGGTRGDLEAMAKVRRYQNLLQEYVELEKEFMTKKKGYESLKMKKTTLMAEVRFLRRRHQQLLRIQAANKELDDFRRQSSIATHAPESTEVPASEPLIGKTYLTMDLHPILAGVLEEGRSLQALPESSLPLPPNKKPKTCSIKEKGMTKKKKISWQDQEPVKV
uniref:Uncharacterized protein n=1 Tax=Kalanchoe fedtschenkoi TaxID=63787 RepID=A0A7N0TB17_KALFE